MRFNRSGKALWHSNFEVSSGADGQSRRVKRALTGVSGISQRKARPPSATTGVDCIPHML